MADINRDDDTLEIASPPRFAMGERVLSRCVVRNDGTFQGRDMLATRLAELQKLRGMTPRAALTKHLLDGDDSFITGAFDTATPDQPKPHTTPEVNGVAPTPGTTTPPSQPGATTFDPDAT